MPKDVEHELDQSRLESLTDGLFATVMTILVLSLVVPVFTGPNLSQQLTSAIFSLLPNLLVYVASFMTLGVMWIGHNNLFRYLHKIDRRYQWLNLLFLLGIGIVPFSTAFLGRYPLQEQAILVYGTNFLLLAAIFNIMGHFILGSYRNVHKDADSKVIRRTYRGNLLSVMVYSTSLILSFLSPYISLALFVFMPIYYITAGLRNPT